MKPLIYQPRDYRPLTDPRAWELFARAAARVEIGKVHPLFQTVGARMATTESATSFEMDLIFMALLANRIAIERGCESLLKIQVVSVESMMANKEPAQ